VNAVAKNRGVTPEAVLKNMADGKLFIGQQALDAGLVDEIGSFGHALALAKASINTRKENDDMDLKELKAKDPEGYSALVNDVRQTVAAENAQTVMTLQEQITKQNGVIEQQNRTILTLEKDKTLREENARKDKAERIWTDELAMSNIPTHLHPKVRNQVNYLNFVSKEGVFNEAAFTEAVKKEIADGWPSAKVIGGGATVREVVDNGEKAQDKEDEAMADKLLDMADSRKLKN